MTKISAIIPVYNAEKYMDKCIESVIGQTYDDFEVLLIDDGSTDSSPAKCDEWAEKYDNIQVVHQPNAGVGAARQRGIENASGEFIAFIDADDYIDEKYLETLYKDIVDNNADIACCDCVELINGTERGVYHTCIYNKIITDPAEVLANILEEKVLNRPNNFYGTVWAKLIRKALLEDLRFMDIQYGEDTVYMLELFKKSPVTVLDTYPGYYYIRNDDSATVKGTNDTAKQLEHCYVGEAVVSLSASTDSNTQAFAANYYAELIYSVPSFIIKHNDKTSFANNYDYICQHINSVLKLNGVKPKYNIMFRFYKHFPKLYWTVLRPVMSRKHQKL